MYNRGVDKRDIVTDDTDRVRFVHGLYEFNDTRPALQYDRSRRRQSHAHAHTNIGSPTSNVSSSMKVDAPVRASEGAQSRPRERLVDIISWCLMPNHFHLLLRQRVEGGITMFMRKLGTGYTNAFNLKHDRSGTLFHGKFKAVHVSREAQLLHLPLYIHANPVDLIEHGWKERGGVQNTKRALKFLASYRWSSYLEYIGVRNFPSLLHAQDVVFLGREGDGHLRALYEGVCGVREFLPQ